MKIGLVILTFNEIMGLASLYDQIPFECFDEAFAVDGGSWDGTREFFQKKGLPCLSQQTAGRGEAFRIAFKKTSSDALIFFGPDGNENPQDLSRFRPYLEQGYDMVIATRMVRGALNEEDHQFFKWRKWANKSFNWMANRTWNRGPFITDSINGFRGITRNAWVTINPDSHGYAIEYQSTIRSFKKNLKLVEFPTREGPRIGRRQGSPSFPTGLSFLKLYFSEMIR